MSTLRVMALHALAYCERLFYLEEVEEIRVADDRVYSGRTLHERLDEGGDFVTLVLESEALGIRGKVDAIRQRDGRVLAYEHKRGRSRSGEHGAETWPSDRLQVGAYAMLLEEALGEPVAEGRVRYHADNALVRIPIDDGLRDDVVRAVARGRELAASTIRPPITDNERLCGRCSLAPVCLPEETRRALEEAHDTLRLFPRTDERRVLHVDGHGTMVGRRGHQLVVTPREGERVCEPIREIASVAVHGYATVSAQALQLCADHGVAVHWFGAGGWYLGSFWRDDAAVQRRIRQYEALRDPAFALSLARRVVHARVEGQLRFVLRATRNRREAASVMEGIDAMRGSLAAVGAADGAATLLGLEGRGAAGYFQCLPELIGDGVDPRMIPQGRSRRPPADRFNALLSFGYGLLMRDVVQAIRYVGLDGSFGFYHRPLWSPENLAGSVQEFWRVDMVTRWRSRGNREQPNAALKVGGCGA